MREKEDKLKEDIKQQQEIERQIDESIRQDEQEIHYRDITKMQAPDQWPDPPKEDKESSDGE